MRAIQYGARVQDADGIADIAALSLPAGHRGPRVDLNASRIVLVAHRLAGILRHRGRRRYVTRIELTNQIEQPRGGGVEMRGELRDLIAKALEIDVAWMSGDEARTSDVHRRISLRRL